MVKLFFIASYYLWLFITRKNKKEYANLCILRLKKEDVPDVIYLYQNTVFAILNMLAHL